MTPPPDQPEPTPLEPGKLTWAALLGQWVAFAQRAVGLPDDDAGRRMRDSVPDIIMLQAVGFALQHLHELEHDQRALGLDRAQVLIERHTHALHRRWADHDMPAELTTLINDAHHHLDEARRHHD